MKITGSRFQENLNPIEEVEKDDEDHYDIALRKAKSSIVKDATHPKRLVDEDEEYSWDSDFD